VGPVLELGLKGGQVRRQIEGGDVRSQHVGTDQRLGFNGHGGDVDLGMGTARVAGFYRIGRQHAKSARRMRVGRLRDSAAPSFLKAPSVCRRVDELKGVRVRRSKPEKGSE
jgi:hypothetical protein